MIRSLNQQTGVGKKALVGVKVGDAINDGVILAVGVHSTDVDVINEVGVGVPCVGDGVADRVAVGLVTVGDCVAGSVPVGVSEGNSVGVVGGAGEGSIPIKS